jgi:hypothetical protein
MNDQTKLGQSERAEVMADLARIGASVCGYHWKPETWAKGPCDCKYLGPVGARGGPSSEQTGCCEIRLAYNVLAGRVLAGEAS